MSTKSGSILLFKPTPGHGISSIKINSLSPVSSPNNANSQMVFKFPTTVGFGRGEEQKKYKVGEPYPSSC